ncbi:MAG: hypothetical protein M0003_10480 [Acidithiobacillus sp.]|nr:hypothetical protein [Acidithiobacillus sp.]
MGRSLTAALSLPGMNAGVSRANWMNNLRHMLGIGSHTKKRQWGYRNRFAPGGADIQSMERLETAGLVYKGRPYADTYFYHATEAGCVAAGLKPYQIRKAMEP